MNVVFAQIPSKLGTPLSLNVGFWIHKEFDLLKTHGTLVPNTLIVLLAYSRVKVTLLIFPPSTTMFE